MKKIFLLLIIIAFGVWTYISVTYANENLIIIVKSNIQGKKILLPGEWHLFPEIVIPGVVLISKIPQIFTYSFEHRFKLPYSEILDYFNLFNVETIFTLSTNYNQKNIGELYYKELDVIKKEAQIKIEKNYEKIILDNLYNPKFSKENLTDIMQKTMADLQIKINIIYFPNWPSYYAMVTGMEKSIYNSNKIISTQIAENYRKSLETKAEQERLKDYFNLIENFTKTIAKNEYKEIIFKLLDIFYPDKKLNIYNK